MKTDVSLAHVIPHLKFMTRDAILLEIKTVILRAVQGELLKDSTITSLLRRAKQIEQSTEQGEFHSRVCNFAMFLEGYPEAPIVHETSVKSSWEIVRALPYDFWTFTIQEKVLTVVPTEKGIPTAECSAKLRGLLVKLGPSVPTKVLLRERDGTPRTVQWLTTSNISLKGPDGYRVIPFNKITKELPCQ